MQVAAVCCHLCYAPGMTLVLSLVCCHHDSFCHPSLQPSLSGALLFEQTTFPKTAAARLRGSLLAFRKAEKSNLESERCFGPVEVGDEEEPTSKCKIC